MGITDCAYNISDFKRIKIPGLNLGNSSLKNERAGRQLDILIPDKSLRRSSPLFNYHVCTSKLPERPFRMVSTGVYIVSPELCFVQVAHTMDVIDAALFGSQLCAKYKIVCGPHDSIGERAPLTTKANILTTLNEMRSPQSNRALHQACKYIIEACASPMEIKMALIIVLPYRYGGYGLAFPSMNYRIELSAQERKNAGLRYVRGDAVWPDVKLDLEYLGKDYHTPEDISADELRRNTIMHAGYCVINVTSNQLTDIERFEQIIEIIAPILGKRIRPEYKGATPARVALFKKLFPWVHEKPQYWF